MKRLVSDGATALSAGGGVVASLVAALAGICCVGPVVVAVLGVSGAVAAAKLQPFRPYLLGFAFVALGFSMWRLYRKRPAKDCESGVCGPRPAVWAQIAVWTGLGLTIASAVLPLFVA